MSEKPHRKLIVWQKSVDFSVLVYKITEQFPSSEKFGITSQFRRASLSISLNIAEGAGRNHVKEFIQFLGIANGSIAELDTVLEVTLRLNYINIDQFNELQEKLNELSALNNGLIKSLKNRT
jgi:four helix bundle protein